MSGLLCFWLAATVAAEFCRHAQLRVARLEPVERREKLGGVPSQCEMP